MQGRQGVCIDDGRVSWVGGMEVAQGLVDGKKLGCDDIRLGRKGPGGAGGGARDVQGCRCSWGGRGV